MFPRRGAIPYLLEGRFYRLAYVETGNPAAPPVLCVHGLTRTGRDFDELAGRLAERYLVVSPDLPGRGNSEWLADPALYQPQHYLAALAALLAAIGRPVAWVGTSLGGICGMLACACPGAPVTRLVLNDIGPTVPAAAIRRIREYLAAAPESFPDVAAVEAYIRQVNAPFGPMSDAQWRHLAVTSARPISGGQVRLHYDRAIIAAFGAVAGVDIDLWPVWEKITQPVLVVRGETSDLLLPETLARMQAAGARAVTIPECGHAPALVDPLSQGAIAEFLAG